MTSMCNCCRRTLSLWLLVVLFCPSPVFSAASAADAVATTITAQKMTVRNRDNRAVFEGTVVLTRGDLLVQSDRMVVLFQPQQENEPAAAAMKTQTNDRRPSQLPSMGNRSVRLIEATGRVEIKQADGQATCRQAIYYAEDDKIVLTGDPVAWQKGARVTGDKIVLYLSEHRSVVEGRSRVLLEPSAEGRP